MGGFEQCGERNEPRVVHQNSYWLSNARATHAQSFFGSGINLLEVVLVASGWTSLCGGPALFGLLPSIRLFRLCSYFPTLQACILRWLPPTHSFTVDLILFHAVLSPVTNLVSFFQFTIHSALPALCSLARSLTHTLHPVALLLLPSLRQSVRQFVYAYTPLSLLLEGLNLLPCCLRVTLMGALLSPPGFILLVVIAQDLLMDAVYTVSAFLNLLLFVGIVTVCFAIAFRYHPACIENLHQHILIFIH